MNQPDNTPSTKVVEAGGSGTGGRAGTFSGFAGSTPGAPNAAQPKPKMTDEELRLEAVRLAVQAKALPAALIDTARSILSFIKSGS